MVNSPTSTTVPMVAPTSTFSPTRNGRSTSSMMPAAMLDSVPCSARPMARPAAPSAAMMDVVFTPNCASTVTMTSTSKA